jgi:hypothetical protein
MHTWHRRETSSAEFKRISAGISLHALTILSLKTSTLLGRVMYTRSSRYHQRKKSKGVRSGDLADHRIGP